MKTRKPWIPFLRWDYDPKLGWVLTACSITLASGMEGTIKVLPDVSRWVDDTE